MGVGDSAWTGAVFLTLYGFCGSFTTPLVMPPYVSSRDVSCFASSSTMTSGAAPAPAPQSPRRPPAVSVSVVNRAQDTLPYHLRCESAFLRHISVETEEMAQLLWKEFLSPGKREGGGGGGADESDSDAFGELARKVSTCVTTREEGGRLGWVNNPFHPKHQHQHPAAEPKDEESLNSLTSSSSSFSLLPSSVVEEFYRRRPKGGDIYIVRDESSEQEQWHLIQVVDLWLDHTPHIRRKRVSVAGSGRVPATPSTLEGGSYHISTVGCQMNAADSERMEGALVDRLQMSLAEQEKEADVVILNTCSIRDHAEQKLYDLVGKVAARKRQGRQVALVVAGCVAQQEGDALLRRFPEVDLVMGPQYVGRLPDLLRDVVDGAHRIVAVDPLLWTEDGNGNGNNNHNNHKDNHENNLVLGNPTDAFATRSSSARGHPVKAWINVIYGCNERCTYCVVPGTRGVEQSRSMEHILAEIKDLPATYREVTLLGQNIDAYGRDMVPKRTFADLLQYLDTFAPPHIRRIRYVTSHPRYFSDRVIDAVANLPRVMECFHVPFQSGDDDVLRAMKRGYTHESYLQIIRKIRRASPDASVCGDVIVGFPGETEEQFQRTLQLMEAVHFDNLNAFAYSPRPFTEAADYARQVPEDVKTDRLHRLQALAVQHGQQRSQRYLGRTVEVLVEDRNPRSTASQTSLMGRTRQGRQVYFDATTTTTTTTTHEAEALLGQIVSIRITEARPWSLRGVLVKEEEEK